MLARCGADNATRCTTVTYCDSVTPESGST
jgi:hypothetical protein